MWEGGGSEALKQDAAKPRPLIGTVTSCDRDGGLINQTTYFPRSALCEGQKICLFALMLNSML